jgi:uncharacterized protein
MDFILGILKDVALYLLATLLHNLPALALGILIAAAMQVYVDPEKMKNWLMRRSQVSIPATVIFGAFTPFCACGTMAVVLAMLATALPWGPVMAFLTSSPLMSPEEFVMMSGIIGPSFAIALAVASVLIGLGSGYATHVIEKKTHFLDGQLRFGSAKESKPAAACGCGAPEGITARPATVQVSCCSSEEDAAACDSAPAEESGCGCGVIALEQPYKVLPAAGFLRRSKIDKLLKAAFDIGVKKILPYFIIFAGIGFIINRLIPQQWISALFGAHNVLAVPLAALVGLPLYINGDSSIPLIQSLMQSGVGAGAMLAFMITGPGTSAGVLAGIATIMKKKAIALYVAYLLAGGIILGYVYDLLTMLFGR